MSEGGHIGTGRTGNIISVGEDRHLFPRSLWGPRDWQRERQFAASIDPELKLQARPERLFEGFPLVPPDRRAQRARRRCGARTVGHSERAAVTPCVRKSVKPSHHGSPSRRASLSPVFFSLSFALHRQPWFPDTPAGRFCQGAEARPVASRRRGRRRTVGVDPRALNHSATRKIPRIHSTCGTVVMKVWARSPKGSTLPPAAPAFFAFRDDERPETTPHRFNCKIAARAV